MHIFFYLLLLFSFLISLLFFSFHFFSDSQYTHLSVVNLHIWLDEQFTSLFELPVLGHWMGRKKKNEKGLMVEKLIRKHVKSLSLSLTFHFLCVSFLPSPSLIARMCMSAYLHLPGYFLVSKCLRISSIEWYCLISAYARCGPMP